MKKSFPALPIVACFSVMIMLSGCGGGSSRINRVSINMGKQEVRTLIGNSYVAKGGKVDKDGNIIDLWEYTDPKSKTIYQIYFLNNQVAQWGRPEDLKDFPELFLPSGKK